MVGPTRCQSCRYDMTGLPLARCPECGGTVFAMVHQAPTPLQLACWAMPIIVCAFIGVQLASTPVSLSWGCDGYTGGLLSISFGDRGRSPKPIFKAASLVVILAPLIPAMLAACSPRGRSLALACVAMLLGQFGIVALCFRHSGGEALSVNAVTVLVVGAMTSFALWCVGAQACQHLGTDGAPNAPPPHPAPDHPPAGGR